MLGILLQPASGLPSEVHGTGEHMLADSLWPSDNILWHRSGSTLAQVMAWCLTAPSHYLNQCWLVIILRSTGAVSQEVLMLLICNICSEITLLKLLPHLSGCSELRQNACTWESSMPVTCQPASAFKEPLGTGMPINYLAKKNIIPGVAFFTKEVNLRLAKRPLIFNGRLANRGLTSLSKGGHGCPGFCCFTYSLNIWLFNSMAMWDHVKYWNQ